jgi:pimeloyl-ACP methyl ester carboxylesterase
MSAIIIDDKIVHYEVLGRGRPVLFLHSWVGSWRTWAAAMQSVAVSFRTYALDLWGFGDTAREPGNYSIKRQATLLDHFLEAMGLGRVAFVGQGLGALAALQFTSKYPMLVDRLMLINLPFKKGQVADRLLTITNPADLADWLPPREASIDPLRADVLKTDPYAITASLETFEGIDPLSILTLLETTCLILHGADDLVVKVPDEAELRNLPDQVHSILLEGCGHYPMLEASKTFNHLLTDFLVQESGDSPRNLKVKGEWKRRVR